MPLAVAELKLPGLPTIEGTSNQLLFAGLEESSGGHGGNRSPAGVSAN
jgi:hypothetical protein